MQVGNYVPAARDFSQRRKETQLNAKPTLARLHIVTKIASAALSALIAIWTGLRPYRPFPARRHSVRASCHRRAGLHEPCVRLRARGVCPLVPGGVAPASSRQSITLRSMLPADRTSGFGRRTWRGGSPNRRFLPSPTRRHRPHRDCRCTRPLSWLFQTIKHLDGRRQTRIFQLALVTSQGVSVVR